MAEAGPAGEQPGAAERAIVARVEELRRRAHAPPPAGAAGLDPRHLIGGLVDEGSLTELGTFASFHSPITALETPWPSGPVGGHATLDGRPVTVVAGGDAATDRRGAKATRLYQMAVGRRNPFVQVLHGTVEPALEERMDKTGTEAARTFGAGPAFPYLVTRERSIPVVGVVTGDTFGSAAFTAGLCDVLVEVEGARLSGAAPTEQPFHPDATGLVDVTAATFEDACAAVRDVLGYLPSFARGPLPVRDVDVGPDDDDLATLVPARRSRAYDVKAVIRRVCDPGSFFELKPSFARNLVTGFARIAGQPVGIVANAPIHSAGALTPDSCVKGVAFIALCDSFGLPLVMLQDVPGFLVSGAAERERAVVRAMAMMQALSLATVPTISVVLRKAFGLAFVVMAANRGVDLLLAWPGAEIGFMDPPVAANVLFEPQVRDLPAEERAAFLAARAAELAVNFEPYSTATHMAIDEVIEPGSTRRRIAEQLRALAPTSGQPRARSLASWPQWL